MTDRVRIGVIGLGIMGEQYVRIYNAHPLATVSAICTRKQARLDEVGDKHGIKSRFTDYVELINLLWYNRPDVYINGEAT